jgi:hypothetical protein
LTLHADDQRVPETENSLSASGAPTASTPCATGRLQVQERFTRQVAVVIGSSDAVRSDG